MIESWLYIGGKLKYAIKAPNLGSPASWFMLCNLNQVASVSSTVKWDNIINP